MFTYKIKFSLTFIILLIGLFFGLQTRSATISKTPAGPSSWMTNGLVGHWTFDGKDVNAAQVLDKSGQGNTGTRNGGVATAVGKNGQAMSFDGVDDYITVSDPGSSSLDLTDNLTFAMWIKLNSYSTDYTRFLAKEITGGAYAFSTRSTGHLSVYFNTLTFDAPVASLQTKVWQHVAVTYSKSLGKITYFSNGVSLGTIDYSESLGTNDVSLTIGARPTGAISIDGLMDDVRVYNRALSATEVKALYQSGAGGGISKTPTPANNSTVGGLVGWWPFNAPASRLKKSCRAVKSEFLSFPFL